MKTLFLGDIHGRNIWSPIINKEKPDRVIFIGDYFDSLDITPIEQIDNFKNIIEFKESSTSEVIMLIGNHDHHYMDVGETYSGFQPAMRWDINQLLKENKHHLQISYVFDDILCSHAGVSPVWLDKHAPKWTRESIVSDLNDLYVYRPSEFNFSHEGYDPYGNHPSQGAIWIRPKALMESNKGDNGLKKHFIQVVGHTQQENIFDSVVATQKSRGGRYYLIDTLPSGGYLTYEDGKFTPNQL
jgi:hypothetical protein